MLRVLLAVVLLLGAGAAMDRWLLPHSNRSAAPAASAVAPQQPSEVPQHFPATARGAGDAAADLETQLSAAIGRPADEARARIAALLAPDATGLADRLAVAATTSAAPGGIRQTVIARVWADNAGDPTNLPVGTRVAVQTYGLALLGAAAEGSASSGELTGAWAVHDLTVELTDAGWRLAEVEAPAPAPPPDVRGTVRDSSPRDPQVLGRVLGPDSWAPGTTP
ncbi:hypothetical protein ACFO1B_44120 [Dactylosporangium siamense]|uniref:hypothetical protein n=1 Tax=Dactylosporangium siamense TaxID=685454 RepID=UPI001942EEDE|nr:hypothetical protein [Dactylosporangium siamense]